MLHWPVFRPAFPSFLFGCPTLSVLCEGWEFFFLFCIRSAFEIDNSTHAIHVLRPFTYKNNPANDPNDPNELPVLDPSELKNPVGRAAFALVLNNCDGMPNVRPNRFASIP